MSITIVGCVVSIARLVPMSDGALNVLKQIDRQPDIYRAFPAAGDGENSARGISKTVERYSTSLNKALGIKTEHCTLHDIRRTGATGLQQIVAQYEVTEAVLNHVSGARGGIAGIYQRHDWGGRRSMLGLSRSGR